MRTTFLHRLSAGVAFAVVLSACSTVPEAPPAPPPPPTLAQLMAKATAASTAGQKEQALTLYTEAGKAYPKDKAPWLKRAQIEFEGNKYGEAILDAQQVLARDTTDTVANSIIAISGLRLSTTALADLARQNNLSGSLRSESQDLAKLLRESIGEAVLVPPPPPPKRVRHHAAKPAAAAAAAASTGADPFGALK